MPTDAAYDRSIDHTPSADAFAGRRAVVTGAAHGIGEAIARRLIGAGAEVIALDRDEAGLARAFGPDECVRVVADLGAEDTAALAGRLLTEHGTVELVVNNVGITTGRTFLQEEDDEVLRHAFRTNLHGPAFFTRRLVRALIDSGRPGSVLFVSSLHDHHIRLHPAYSVAKAGVAMLTRELAYELAPHRIRVNAVSPGWIETAKPGERPIAAQRATDLIPAGRFGRPDDVARIALTLLDDVWSSYVTGTNVVVDGGLSLHNWLMDG